MHTVHAENIHRFARFVHKHTFSQKSDFEKCFSYQEVVSKLFSLVFLKITSKQLIQLPVNFNNFTMPPSINQKKMASHCVSCGQKGHWKGDNQCPNVQNGKDKPHKRPDRGPPTTSSGGNAVHFTFAVTATKKTKVTEVHRNTTCPKCRWPSFILFLSCTVLCTVRARPSSR